MDFVMRTSKPSAGNKYYIRKENGGYSDAIEGSPKDAECDVLANCVGYAYGRFNEIGNYGSCKYLAPVNAENFMQFKGSCKTGQTPRVGACMVWQKGATLSGSDGAGHVAIVEKVINPTAVYTSESGYKSRAFWNQNREKGSGNWGMGDNYKFLGFIYNPAVQNETPSEGNTSGESVKTDTSASSGTSSGTSGTLNDSKNGSTSSSAGIRAGDRVKILENAVYFGQSTKVPDWVKEKQWIVKEVSGNRVVIDKSADGKNAICSAVDAKHLQVVNAFAEYRVEVTASSGLNIRKDAGTDFSVVGCLYKGDVQTIVDEKQGTGAGKWGKLKSLAGWISLDYVEKI